MSLVIGISLIVIPVMFNWTFAALSKQFEYPDILRKPTHEVLAKFRSGGSKLVLTWWLFAMSAVFFGALAVAVPAYLEFGSFLLTITVTFGILASATQFLGLVRWPFMVPHLAREAQNASAEKATAIDVVFQSFNRYLGVAVGEHLGYLFTGLWTITLSLGLLVNEAADGQSWIMALAISGLIIGSLLALCSLEFVGKNELKGWAIAGRLTPIVYVLWSVWLMLLGITLLIHPPLY